VFFIIFFLSCDEIDATQIKNVENKAKRNETKKQPSIQMTTLS